MHVGCSKFTTPWFCGLSAHIWMCVQRSLGSRVHMFCVHVVCAQVVCTYLIDVPHTCALGEHTGSSLLCGHVLGTVGAVCMRVLCGGCVHILRVCMRAGTHMVHCARLCF